jgi:hypothetical protein
MSEHPRGKNCLKPVFYEKSRFNRDKKVLNSPGSFRGAEGRYTRLTREEILPGYRRGTGDFPVESEENKDYQWVPSSPGRPLRVPNWSGQGWERYLFSEGTIYESGIFM